MPYLTSLPCASLSSKLRALSENFFLSGKAEKCVAPSGMAYFSNAE
jgi:hypothetical protein